MPESLSLAGDILSALANLLQTLKEADEFYSTLGGIVGYQAQCLELISNKETPSAPSVTDGSDDIQVLSCPLIPIVCLLRDGHRWDRFCTPESMDSLHYR